MAIAQPAPTPTAQPAGSVESLTYKQLTARLDEVHYSLQGIQANIEQFRLDFRSGLGRTAAIRVLDMGVALVRDRAVLNRVPRLIAAMNREGRADYLQRQRKDEQDKRLKELIARHGQLNRAIEGYAADLKERFGIDIQGFLDAISSQIAEGKNVDAAISYATQAVRENNIAGFNQVKEQLMKGEPVTPPRQEPNPVQPPPVQPPPVQPPPVQPSDDPNAGKTQNDIRSIGVDPNNPNNLLITFANGSTASVPFTRGPNGELIFTLPNGQQVTVPVQVGADGVPFGLLPNGARASVSPDLRPQPTMPPNARKVEGGWVIPDPVTGEERYFPADLTKPGIGTRYLGDKGTRLIEETQEFLDLTGGGQYKIRQAQSVRWQFAVAPTGQASEAGGTRASFKLSDRTGQGRFTVAGWRILQDQGAQVASGSGEEAVAVVTQSGTYKVEFSGTTEWGSPFRIEAQVQIAVQ